MKKLTKEEVIKRLIEKRGNDFDYSNIEYKNRRTPIEILCKKHNLSFNTYLENFLNGETKGCKECALESFRSKKGFSKEEIIEQFKQVHGNRYDYSKVKYVNIDTPVEIICKEHGSFFQIPYEHKNGSNCPRCFGLNKTNEEVINNAIKVHGDLYDYSKLEYVNAREKMTITCKLHGDFFQNYTNHVFLRTGCPICNSSKGEKEILKILKENNINNNMHYSFKDCRDKQPLPFDFYLPEHNLVIEFDGIEHFEPIGFGGDANKNFEETVKHDKMKDEYCKKNNIDILRIKYTENIFDCLCKKLNLKEQVKKDLVDNIYNSIKDISFPFDNYPEHELNNDFKDLMKDCKKNTGLKIVKQFHPNIYTSKVNKINMVEAWSNEALLKKCIKNRIIYKGSNLSIKQIRDGLNIAKIAPKVSVFRPSLARFLIFRYLNKFDTIFDPFSGFSGRMLGACSLNKKYIGQDINKDMVNGSNEIIKKFNINAEVIQKDIFDSTGKYDCLFTCSPYNLKETWGQDIKNLSCDEWIDECLKRFDCKKYLFVVDNTEKYKTNVVEYIYNTSHFNKNTEKVVLIEK